MDVIIWAILVIAFVIAEVATVQLVSVWFAAGALVTMILVFFFDIPIIGQVGIFIGSSALFLALTMPYIIRMKKRLSKNWEKGRKRATYLRIPSSR